MRKTTFALGLGLALSVGAAELAAQVPAPRDTAKAGAARPGVRGERGERARGARMKQARGPRGAGMLLRGISLTDAQKAQLKTLHEQQRTAMQANAETRRKAMEEMRAARQRGDTAAVRRFREQQRTQMAQQHDRHTAAVRAILTAEQRTQFDRNVAEMKQRMEQRAARARDGRGRRGGPPGAPRPQGTAQHGAHQG